jgi:hypothetical protein
MRAGDLPVSETGPSTLAVQVCSPGREVSILPIPANERLCDNSAPGNLFRPDILELPRHPPGKEPLRALFSG